MPRKKRQYHVSDAVDPRYKDPRLGALISKIMLHGKRQIATTIVYEALEKSAAKLKKDPIEVFDQALENIMPMVEVRSRRIGGANYQVPTEVNPRRRLSLALRWLVTATRAGKGRPMAERLATEFMDAYNETGTVVKKREETHRMAEANRALAHYSRF